MRLIDFVRGQTFVDTMIGWLLDAAFRVLVLIVQDLAVNFQNRKNGGGHEAFGAILFDDLADLIERRRIVDDLPSVIFEIVGDNV